MKNVNFHLRSSARILAALFGLFGSSAYASSFPFTGTAIVDASTFGDAHLTGPNLSLTILAQQGGGDSILQCESGVSCGGQFNINGENGIDPTSAFGILDGKVAAHILGALILTSPTFSVDGAASGPYTHQESLAVTGSLTGYNISDQEVFMVNVAGTGNTTLTGNASQINSRTFVNIASADFTFAGQATATPEPSSLFLMTAGTLLVAVAFRRARSSRFKS